MYAFVIVTNKINFSIAIKEYFLSLSPMNFNNSKIFVYGTDEKNEEEIIKDLKEIMEKNKKIKKCFIFSDFGDPFNSSKVIENEIRDSIYSKGSLIETGFLAFQLINGSAPIESIMLAINRTIEK